MEELSENVMRYIEYYLLFCTSNQHFPDTHSSLHLGSSFLLLFLLHETVVVDLGVRERVDEETEDSEKLLWLRLLGFFTITLGDFLKLQNDG